MRLHTDNLTHADIRRALTLADLPDVWLWECTPRGSRSRQYAFEIRLIAEPGRDRNGKARRATNLGNAGAGYETAATYDEWGYFIAELFALDPDATFGPYKGREHFNQLTGHDYHLGD